MKDDEGTGGRAEELRRRAEQRLAGRAEATDGRERSEVEMRRLVHELQVHRIELELQNEELERSRSEVESALARYTDLYELAPVGYLSLGPDGAVRQVNLTGARQLGLERSRLVGRRLGALVADESRPPLAACLEALFGLRVRKNCTVTVRPEGAAPIVLELTGAPTDDGQECRVVAVDVTERTRLEQEREALRASLAQADRLATMGMLAAGVAHEINNPLSYVIYHVETLAQDLPRLASLMERCHAELTALAGAEGVRRALGRDHEVFSPAAFDDAVVRLKETLGGTLRIRDIARSLGTYARVEPTETRPIDVNASAEHAITIASNEIKYRARLVKDLGRIPVVLASEGKLAQVFLNLLINAAHAIEEGHVEHNEIRVRTWSEGSHVIAEVGDTGRGIAPELQARIFEPFFTTKGAGVGSGLGLSICRNIVNGFGGEIRLSSEVGKGARFQIRLPRLPSDWRLPVEDVPAPAPARGTVRGRILVVDDEAGIRATMPRMLRGHEVVTAASGLEAKKLLEDDRGFDVIYCDLMMPEMTGMELHAWLAERDPALAEQVVFVSGGAFTPGSSGYLSKVGNLRLEKPLDSVVLKRMTGELVLAARAKRGA